MTSPTTQTTGEFDRQSLGLLGAAFVALLFGMPVVAMTALGVFMQPMTDELGWGRAQLAAAITIAQWAGIASGPCTGWLVDRYGARKVALLMPGLGGPLAVAIGLAAGHSLLAFYAVHFLLGLLIVSPIAIGSMLSASFERHRGLALSAIAAGAFTSGALIPPVAEVLLGTVGWRSAYAVIGALLWLVPLPLMAWLLRSREGTRSSVAPSVAEQAAAHSMPADSTPLKIAVLMRNRTYWWLIGTLAGGVFAYFAIEAHLVAMITERGFPRTLAVSALSAVSIGALAAHLCVGLLLDRLRTSKVLLPFIAAALAGLGLLHWAESPTMLVAAAFVAGLGVGGENGVTPYFVSRYFGVAHYSRAYGILVPAIKVIGAPAPLVVGLMRDASGSYATSVVLVELALLCSLFCLSRLGPYTQPPQACERTVSTSLRMPAESLTNAN